MADLRRRLDRLESEAGAAEAARVRAMSDESLEAMAGDCPSWWDGVLRAMTDGELDNLLNSPQPERFFKRMATKYGQGVP